MRLKLPISLAPIPFYKGFSALQVRLTPKSGDRLTLIASFRLIKGSLSVRLLRTISPTASDSQSVTRELVVRQDGLSQKKNPRQSTTIVGNSRYLYGTLKESRNLCTSFLLFLRQIANAGQGEVGGREPLGATISVGDGSVACHPVGYGAVGGDDAVDGNH